MEPKRESRSKKPILLGIIIAVLILVNFIFVTFASNEDKTITLLNSELAVLEQDRQIIVSANDISKKYATEIEAISRVFPGEETLPDFIQQFEELLKNNTVSYTFKFNSVTPIKEQDRLYIPLNVTARADLVQLITILKLLEKEAFMTHINAINVKTPDGFSQVSEVNLIIKLYVQNPFTTK